MDATLGLTLALWTTWITSRAVMASARITLALGDAVRREAHHHQRPYTPVACHLAYVQTTISAQIVWPFAISRCARQGSTPQSGRHGSFTRRRPRAPKTDRRSPGALRHSKVLALASITACVRLDAPNLLKMARKYIFIVTSDAPSVQAISLLVLPSETSFRMFTSFGVSSF